MGYCIDHEHGHLPLEVYLDLGSVLIQGLVCQVEHVVGLVLEVEFRTAPVFLEIAMAWHSVTALELL